MHQVRQVQKKPVGSRKRVGSFYCSSLKNWATKRVTAQDRTVGTSQDDIIISDSDDNDDDENSAGKYSISCVLKEVQSNNLSFPNLEVKTDSGVLRQDSLRNSRLTAYHDSNPNDLILEIDSDDDIAQSPINSVILSDRDSDVESKKASAAKALDVHSSVIEIDSESCSSIGEVTMQAVQRCSASIRAKNCLTTSFLSQSQNDHREQNSCTLLEMNSVNDKKFQGTFQSEFQNFCHNNEELYFNCEQDGIGGEIGYQSINKLCNGNFKDPLINSWHQPVIANSSASNGIGLQNARDVGSIFNSLSVRGAAENVFHSNILENSDGEAMSFSGLPPSRKYQMTPHNAEMSVAERTKLHRNGRSKLLAYKLKNNGNKACWNDKSSKRTKDKNKICFATVDKKTPKNTEVRKEELAKGKTLDMPEKEGDRPVAKTLMDLGKQLVSKEVIKHLIIVTKKSLEKTSEDTGLEIKFQNRYTELKQALSQFALKQKHCLCGRFKSESSNVLLAHLEHGSSSTKYRCCFCSSTTLSHITFSRHMTKQHNIKGHKLLRKWNFSCPFCHFNTNTSTIFESHKMCCRITFQENRNLHPKLEDFDIPVRYDDKKEQLVARQISIAANISQFSSSEFCLERPPDKELCRNKKTGLCSFCGKSFANCVQLGRHIMSMHRKQCDKRMILRIRQTNGSRKSKCEKSPRTQMNVLKCCFCGKQLGNQAVQHFLSAHHISLNTMVRKRYCYFCQLPLANVKSFEQHMLKIHCKLFKNIKLLWKKIFSSIKISERGFLLEYDSTGGNSNQQWRCVQCKKSFALSCFGYRHSVFVHAFEKIECQICPSMIHSGATYTEHLQECHMKACQVLLQRYLLPVDRILPGV